MQKTDLYKDLIDWETLNSEIIPDFINQGYEINSDAFALRRTKQWTKHLARNYPESQMLFDQIKRVTDFRELASQYGLNS